jgi:HD superfamily phosphodiesterase
MVANNANLLSKKLKLSKEEQEILTIASLFHDVAKSKRVNKAGLLNGSREHETRNGKTPHEVESAEMVEKILKGRLPDQKIKMVKNTIVNHSSPSTIIEKILHDADELAEMGAVNIWKMFTYSSRKKRSLEDTIRYWKMQDKKRHQVKTDGLYLKESKREGQRRIKIVNEILDDLEQQILSITQPANIKS